MQSILTQTVIKTTDRHKKYITKCFTWNQHTMRQEHTEQTNNKKKTLITIATQILAIIRTIVIKNKMYNNKNNSQKMTLAQS